MKSFPRTIPGAAFAGALMISLAAAQADAATDTMSVVTPTGTATAYAYDYSGYAICRFTFKGVEYIDGYDHGRCLQTAVNYYDTTPYIPETFNPTEGGGDYDGLLPNPSSTSVTSHSGGSSLSSSKFMAFWKMVGSVKTSNHILERTVVNFDPTTYLGHVWRFDIETTSPTTDPAHLQGQYELLTGYMPPAFSNFYKYNPVTDVVSTLTDGPGEQVYPVFFCNSADTNCMGVIGFFGAGNYSPPLGGYGRWRYPATGTGSCVTSAGATGCVKWDIVTRINNPINGHTYSASVYMAFGDKASMTAIFNDLYARSVLGSL